VIHHPLPRPSGSEKEPNSKWRRSNKTKFVLDFYIEII
jgi:hypothetical protein